MILLAGQQDSPAADDALAHLCRAYWYPLYAFARRRGHAIEEAEDLTQEFLAYLIEKRRLAVADAAKGRFRSFLLTAFKHFMSDVADRRDAAKRGGKVSTVSLNLQEAEQKLALTGFTVTQRSGCSSASGRAPCSLESPLNCASPSSAKDARNNSID